MTEIETEHAFLLAVACALVRLAGRVGYQGDEVAQEDEVSIAEDEEVALSIYIHSII